MDQQPTDALLIFIKNSELGKVKTRLAATVGNEQALKIYEELLRYTRQTTLEIPAARHLFYSDFLEKNDDWNIDFFQKSVQQGSDLGERMSNAFDFIFNQKFQKAVIIGSDCPTLTSEILHQAFTALDHCDLVVGPATDGGYYLLGMKKLHRALFQNIVWSSENVLSKTLRKAQELNLSTYQLASLPDVDYEEDWIKYGWKIER